MADLSTQIDEIDAKILKALLHDARTNFTDIARACGVSTNAIVNRFQKLKRSEIITGTALRVNLQEMGFTNRLSVDINVESGKETEVLEALKKIPDFVACYPVVGCYDIHTVVYIKNIGEIEHITDKIKKLDGITRIRLTATYDGRFFPENLLIKPTETS